MAEKEKNNNVQERYREEYNRYKKQVDKTKTEGKKAA